MKTFPISKLGLSLFVGLLLSSAVALHAQPSDSSAPPSDGPEGRPHPLLMMFDSDHDGVITAIEIAEVAARVQALDTNGDGVVSEDELPGPPPRGQGQGQGSGRGGPPPGRDS